ncbi:MAG: LVIVD repeat-containing protein [Solirubrobacteraceae bacterium]
MPAARRASLVVVLVSALAVAAPSAAQGPLGALNDLGALSQGTGQTPDTVPVQKPAAPPMDAVPRADCGPGAKPEPSIQGRVPAGAAANGLQCNLVQISHQGTSGGFKVYRYVDAAGHECAYYDTALLFPLNAFNVNTEGLGVAVLDMSDPAHPVQTATLTEPAMLSPHESLNLNQRRGLLAAVTGNPGTYPGYVSIYDVSKDCRAPELQSSGLYARLGHESGFSEDGRTFYAAGTATQSITAIDVTDPKAPHAVWQGNVVSHGMTLSEDGNRAYIAEPIGRQLLILDTSEIQARKANPQAREISRTTWDRASIPQNAIPFTRGGKPYVLEFDEYNASTLGSGSADDVGAGRILDVSDERAPKVVSNLRLQINQPAEHKEFGADPGADGQIRGGAQGYAAHYCNIPTRVDPTIVACSFIASGLRLFDISDVTAPKEIGYYVPPTNARVENSGMASAYAMSQPVFVPARHEVWFTDGTSGFYALRVVNGAWPAATPATPGGGAKACRSQRVFTIHLKHPDGDRTRSARVTVDGKRVKVRSGTPHFTARVDLRGKRKKVVVVRVVSRTKSGRVVRETRRYRTCSPGRAR